jgi:group I intron endonuclease
MLIYLITNKINGKRYVGQTIQTLRNRWHGHKQASLPGKSTVPLYNAIRKYGLENFEIKVLSRSHSMEELNHREAYCIKLLGTLSPNGYNLATGGSNSLHSQETKDKISKIKTGKKIGPYTEQHSKNMSIAQKGIPKPHSKEWCENHKNKMTGRKHSEESKQKRRDGGKCKKIFSPETNKTYGSIAKAGREHGISPANIHTLMHGKIKFLRDKVTGQKLTFIRVEK